MAERASEVRDVLEESHDVEYVVSHEDMAGLVKKLNNGNLTDLLHLCKRHLDFQNTGTDFKHGMHLVMFTSYGQGNF